MTDHNEGGSRAAGSSHQQPAQTRAAGASEPARGTVAPETPTSAPVDGDEERGARPVSADMQHFIGRQLRAVFDDVAKQPIPDRFLELMKQLDSKTEAR